MTEDEFEFLKTPRAQQLIAEHLHDNPAAFALQCKQRDIPVAALANQLKYLQRCKTKLPDYYDAGCIISSVSYEQASSYATALGKQFEGEACLDLTCGLGVDSFYFSKRFKQVVSLEKNELLTKIARHNFALLKAPNIEVYNTSAEDYLSDYAGNPFDLIYVDPSRRDTAKQRVFLLEDCSPDVRQLLPLLLKHSKQVLLKLSPLFDVDEAVRLFSPYLKSIEVVSVRNECKELLLLLSSEGTESPILICSLIDILGAIKQYSFPLHQEESTKTSFEIIDSSKFIYEPDVAFYKARKVSSLFAGCYPNKGFLPAADSFYFSSELLPDFPGRTFAIQQQMEYQPKQLKQWLKQNDIKRLNVVKRNFPLSTQEIRKALSVTEGGEWFLLCTTLLPTKRMCFLGKRI